MNVEFRKSFEKEASRHYILYLPDESKIQEITRDEFLTIHDTHWQIETFHRAISPSMWNLSFHGVPIFNHVSGSQQFQRV